MSVSASKTLDFSPYSDGVPREVNDQTINRRFGKFSETSSPILPEPIITIANKVLAGGFNLGKSEELREISVKG